MAFDPLHMINLSRDGRFRKVGQHASSPADVDRLFEHLRQQQVSHLVLYFHGGLVSEAAGVADAENLLKKFDWQGAHPVFFIWETGLFEILAQLQGHSSQWWLRSLIELARRAHDTLIRKRLPFFRAAPEGFAPLSGELGLPEEEIEPMDENLALPEAEQEVAQALVEPLTPDEEATLRSEMEEAVELRGLLAELEAMPIEGVALPELPELEMGGLADIDVGIPREAATSVKRAGIKEIVIQVVGRVIDRERNGTAHGEVTTVEEVLRATSFGNLVTAIWEQMKKNAKEAFTSTDDASPDVIRGGFYFLQRLREYTSDAQNPKLHVSLVGHSAGAIYICRLFEKAVEVLDETFRFNNIILLAPGVDVELFRQTIMAHPNRYRRFRLFALQDRLERTDAVVPLLYPRSLLYFVSGVLEGEREGPLVGMQRFFLPQRPYNQNKALVEVGKFLSEEGQNRVVWSVAQGNEEGLNCDAVSHGNFLGKAPMQSSLKRLLQPSPE